MAQTVSPSHTTTLAEPDTLGPFKMESAVQWAKWVVLGSIVAGLVLLVAIGVISYTEQQRVDELRKNWDNVYSALKGLKDDAKPADHIAALESVAEKVKGTPAHAYVLLKLGNMYFEEGLRPEKFQEERTADLKKAASLYELIANNEPYKSKAFGPLAVENLALVHEQLHQFKEGIDVLNNALGTGALDSHYLYHEMLAHLGRLYWLKSEEERVQSESATKEDEKKRLAEASAQDRKLANAKISEALRESAVKNEHSEWHKDAMYIKSLVYEKPGSALPDGKIPPPKPAVPKMNYQLPPNHPNINLPPQSITVPPVSTPATLPPHSTIPPATPAPATTPAKPVDPAKPDANKKDEKKEEKKDEKKQGSVPPAQDDPQTAEVVTQSPSGHLTFAQMQQMLKEGKQPFCQCPRCLSGQKPASAKLVE